MCVCACVRVCARALRVCVYVERAGVGAFPQVSPYIKEQEPVRIIKQRTHTHTHFLLYPPAPPSPPPKPARMHTPPTHHTPSVIIIRRRTMAGTNCITRKQHPTPQNKYHTNPLKTEGGVAVFCCFCFCFYFTFFKLFTRAAIIIANFPPHQNR